MAVGVIVLVAAWAALAVGGVLNPPVCQPGWLW